MFRNDAFDMSQIRKFSLQEMKGQREIRYCQIKTLLRRF